MDRKLQRHRADSHATARLSCWWNNGWVLRNWISARQIDRADGWFFPTRQQRPAWTDCLIFILFTNIQKLCDHRSTVTHGQTDRQTDDLPQHNRSLLATRYHALNYFTPTTTVGACSKTEKYRTDVAIFWNTDTELSRQLKCRRKHWKPTSTQELLDIDRRLAGMLMRPWDSRTETETKTNETETSVVREGRPGHSRGLW